MYGLVWIDANKTEHVLVTDSMATRDAAMAMVEHWGHRAFIASGSELRRFADAQRLLHS